MDENDLLLETATPAAAAGSGRGRGRGRGGGVPVLPVGMWKEMNPTNDEELSLDSNRGILSAGVSLSSTTNDYDDNDNDRDENNDRTLEEMKQMTFGGFGRGRGKKDFMNDKSPGGFARDAKGVDWNCPSCGNVNWSWRTNCNRCSTAKPVIKVYTEGELRDGIGGGFNERQDRVAATTVEIAEDGFDDFGRRAKGGRNDKSAKELAALARLQSNYGFLLNPENVVGQFDDSNEAKPSQTSKFGQDKSGKSANNNNATGKPSNNSERYVPPRSTGNSSGGGGSGSGGGGRGRDSDRGRDSRESGDKGGRGKGGIERKSRSRSRDRNERKGGRDREHENNWRDKERGGGGGGYGEKDFRRGGEQRDRSRDGGRGRR